MDRESFRSLGFQQDFPPKDILIGIIIGFEVMFLGFMSLTLTNQLAFLVFPYSFTDLLPVSYTHLESVGCYPRLYSGA